MRENTRSISTCAQLYAKKGGGQKNTYDLNFCAAVRQPVPPDSAVCAERTNDLQGKTFVFSVQGVEEVCAEICFWYVQRATRTRRRARVRANSEPNPH